MSNSAITDDKIDALRLPRAITHIISGILSWCLFIFCIIKGYRKRIPNKFNRCNTIKLESFSITDIQVMMMSLYDGLNSLFFMALFDRNTIKTNYDSQTMSTYDYIWGSTQVFFETGGVIAYTLLCIYTITILMHTIRQTQIIIKTRQNQFYKPPKHKISIILRNEKATKICFLCIQLILPFILMGVPHLLKEGYCHSNLALWPFLNSHKYYSIYFYYIFIFISCIASIIQLIFSIYSLCIIKKMGKIIYDNKNASSMLSSDESNDFVDADADFGGFQVGESSTGSNSKSVNTKYKMPKAERKVFISALLKNLMLTIGFAIQWWPTALMRLITAGAHDDTNFDYMVVFHVTGPNLSFLTSAMYFIRIGITVQCKRITKMKKKRDIAKRTSKLVRPAIDAI